MLLKTLLLLCALCASTYAQTAPKPLTDTERLAVMELLTTKYAADSDESELRQQLDTLVQQKLGEARTKRAAAVRAVEDKILELCAVRSCDPKTWILDAKTGVWKQRDTTAADAVAAKVQAAQAK